MRKHSFYQVLFLFISSTVTFYAQPGKNGTLSVSNTTVLNHYSPVTADLQVGSATVGVVAQTALLGLCPGDLIMIYQAQGATISTVNTLAYGSITAYNNAGLYEFIYVKNVVGNTINLVGSLQNSYTSSGMTQVIKVPQYSTLTINNNGSVGPRPWKDTVVSSVSYRFGGITAIHAANILNNGIITASFSGLRGGQLDLINTSAYSSGITSYVSTINSYGGEKGESIAGYQPEYDLLSGRYGRGAPANGGGGGNGWNAGGGGGANGNNSNVWTGQGVMIVNASNPLVAWALDPGYIANTNVLTNSSGGGRGGYSLGATNANATIVGPGNSGWAGDNRREVGGLGGHPLTAISAANRMFFGGGGGAGDENNANGGAGGTGGGIVYLIASNGLNGSGTISANGADGFSTTGLGYDAPGGGGAGGSVIIISASVSLGQIVSAKGGKGGDQFIGNNESEGPGGGGGGGFVAISSVGLLPNVNGDIGGSTNSTALTEFPFDGSTSGAAGQTATIANTFIPFNQSLIVVAGNNSTICKGSNLNLTASPVGNAFYSWSGPGGFTSSIQNPTITAAQNNAAGVYTLSVIITGCQNLVTTTSVTILAAPSPTVNSPKVCHGQTATITASGGSTYQWNTGATTSAISVTPSINTSYTVTVSNGICSAFAVGSVTVMECTSVTEINKTEDQFSIYPNPGSGHFVISSSIESSFEIMVYNCIGCLIEKKIMDGKSISFDLTNSPKGIYHIQVRSQNINRVEKIIIE